MSKCGCNEGIKGNLHPEFRNAIKLVIGLNLAYFFVEFFVARAIGSVSLFADSVDFLEDASVNGLILLAIGWTAVRRARIGMILAGLILIPGAAALWTAWQKFMLLTPPLPIPLTITGIGALGVNLTCALILNKYRQHSGSMTKAAFLYARNDVLANLGIISAGLMTIYIPSAWPDLIVGLGIAIMNIGAAKEVFETAKEEHREASL